jgi:two-component system chemotaxis response regulator CheY
MIKVLVVDDALFMRTVLKNILEEIGDIEVIMAQDGKEGLIEYEKSKPDIVFLDITMPVLNGIETLERIKKIDPNAKVIMCSAMGQQPFVQKSIILGALDFVVKPFKKERIIELIKKYNII